MGNLINKKLAESEENELKAVNAFIDHILDRPGNTLERMLYQKMLLFIFKAVQKSLSTVSLHILDQRITFNIELDNTVPE